MDIRCTMCKELKDEEEFYVRTSSSTGRRSQCKGCDEEYRQTSSCKEAYRRYAMSDKGVVSAKASDDRNKGTVARKASRSRYGNSVKGIAARHKRIAGYRESNPAYRTLRSLYNTARGVLRGTNTGKNLRKLVGYSGVEFKQHMISLFEPGMTLDNYGTVWSVDHRKAVSLFDFTVDTDRQLRRCWALKNVMPRFVTTDIAKLFGSAQVGNCDKSIRAIA